MEVITLEKVSFSNIQNPKTVNTMPPNDKHYLLNTDNLTPTIQVELSQIQKTFAEFFFFHF